MAITLARNTIAGELLASVVERVETIRTRKQQASQDEAAVMAEAKAQGLIPAAIKFVVKRRAEKPHDVQESEAIKDLYLNAMGMATETPLFRTVGLMSVDITARESVIEAMKAFVPANGAITIEAGGKPVKLTRGKDGTVIVAEVEKAKPQVAEKPATPAREKPPVPDVDDAGAHELGREAFRQNQPIVLNPFPFGDTRRQHFDKGWRAESGSDGMGPDD